VTSWKRVPLAALFVIGGSMHFVSPRAYAEIVPHWLPNAPMLVAISGVCEILGGMGVLFGPTCRLAGWGLLALLVAVFPANIQMLQSAYAGHASTVSTVWIVALWARLPLQPALMWWVWSVAANAPR
jgi:uncharacterized membrane protein